MALEPHWQTGAIRFSLGMATTSAEVDRVLAVLPGLVSELRAPAPAA
jgi:cysteine desulfurase